MQEQLKFFQQQLKNINYYTGNIDGLWGSRSQLALNHAIRDGKVEIYFDFIKFKKIFDRPKITQDFVNSINIINIDDNYDVLKYNNNSTILNFELKDFDGSYPTFKIVLDFYIYTLGDIF